MSALDNYDPKCKELADYFLEDSPANSPANRHRLAGIIQMWVELELGSIENEHRSKAEAMNKEGA